MTTSNYRNHEVNCQPVCNPEPKTMPSGLNLVLLAPRLVAGSFWGAAEVVRKTLDGGFAPYCPLCQGHHVKNQACCGIPQSNCPDPCVCRIHWVGCPGDSFNYHIQICNSSKKQREFILTSHPFPCTNEQVKVTPNKKILKADESLKAIASFTVPDTFAGSTYLTHISVVGAYKQYIEVCLMVPPKQACCCSIEQGDIPKHVKAHHWFHHFQCEEECFEPTDERD